MWFWRKGLIHSVGEAVVARSHMPTPLQTALNLAHTLAPTWPAQIFQHILAVAVLVEQRIYVEHQRTPKIKMSEYDTFLGTPWICTSALSEEG